MPADPWNEALQMLLCFLAVAALAVPAGLAAWWTARRKHVALLPRPRGWRVPWGGFEVFVAFVVISLMLPTLVAPALEQTGFYQQLYGGDFPRAGSAVESDDADVQRRIAEAPTIRAIWIGLISLPLQLGLLVAVRNALYPTWSTQKREPALPGSVALAVWAWLALTVCVLVIHFAVLFAFKLAGWPIEEHPLAHVVPTHTRLDQVLFVLRICVAAPLIEEVFFRGILLPWLLGQKYRAWPTLAVAVMFAAALTWNTESGPARGPTLFALGLLGGWMVLRATLGRKRRTIGAIYASAALFAVVHSNVWPSPVPLFVLGLGLGWLAVRTRGVLVPIIVHGLFNAVSALFVLRGG